MRLALTLLLLFAGATTGAAAPTFDGGQVSLQDVLVRTSMLSAPTVTVSTLRDTLVRVSTLHDVEVEP